MTGWIADVEPYEPIEDTWGNTIRDRTIHRFANNAQRDSTISNVQPGMLCYTESNFTLWLATPGYSGGYPVTWQDITLTSWRAFTPRIFFGGTASTVSPHDCAFRRVGSGWELAASFVVAASGTSGDQVVRMALDAPFTAWVPAPPLAAYIHTIGIGTQLHTNGQGLTYAVSLEARNGLTFRPTGYPSAPGAILGTHVTAGDQFDFHAAYRAETFGALLLDALDEPAEGKPAEK